MIHERHALGGAVSEAFDSPEFGGKQGNATLVAHPSPSYSQKVTVKGLVELPEWKGVFTESAIRALIDKSRPRRSSRGVIPGNGLLESGAIIRLNRKILFDTDKFRAWVESHRLTGRS